MMRQLGGSFGIAGLATTVHIGKGQHRNYLLENINEYGSPYWERTQDYISSFMGKGFLILMLLKWLYML